MYTSHEQYLVPVVKYAGRNYDHSKMKNMQTNRTRKTYPRI